jgi:hypothetical protein
MTRGWEWSLRNDPDGREWSPRNDPDGWEWSLRNDPMVGVEPAE